MIKILDSLAYFRASYSNFLICLSISFSFHSQYDRRIERFNSILDVYLRYFIFTSQKIWVILLDAAHVCFNAKKSSSIHKSPSEIVISQQPSLPQILILVQSPLRQMISLKNETKYWNCLKLSWESSKTLQKHCFLEIYLRDVVMVKFPNSYYKPTIEKDSRLVPKYIESWSGLKKSHTEQNSLHGTKSKMSSM